jgi:hypothetical protein
VRTKPAEVIQTDGEPKFETVKNTNLLYVANSGRRHHHGHRLAAVLRADRGSLVHDQVARGWSVGLRAGDKLPPEFPKIPEASDLADVRPMCRARPKRKKPCSRTRSRRQRRSIARRRTVDVKYDGDPKFKAIEGTKMSYAINTDKSVLLIDSRYYCCDKAIWFESNGRADPGR